VHQPDRSLKIGSKTIAEDQPSYFIADIAANHDGSLARAKELIHLAAAAGADAAKFQHFKAGTIVSDQGFRAIGGQQSHQANWKKSVFEVYQDASVPMMWTRELKQTCDEAGIAFFTSPYDLDIVDQVDEFVPAFKVGSGDITWHEIVRHIAAKGKPTLIASGASTMDEVHSAVCQALALNPQVALMQCNTNYTADIANYRHIQLNVLKCYRAMYPDMVLGLSDHTCGHASVLGAVALGARMIEKHFTDDTSREGPDHHFAMDPKAWRDMVQATRELEAALVNGVKRVELNERETAVLQRRCLRAASDLPAGASIERGQLTVLRPCPAGAIDPTHLPAVLGRRTARAVKAGELLQWTDLA
jgi:sialic acid synthase SpsE